MDPFLPIYDKKRLSERLCEELLPHFDSLTKEDLEKIFDLLFNDLCEMLAERDMKIEISKDAKAVELRCRTV